MGADQHHDWHAQIASALDWWRDAGVDVAVQDAPRDWLAPLPIAVTLAKPIVAPTVAAPPLPATLAAFASWRTGEAAPERGWGGRLFAAEGPVDAALMVLIEMPEREDAAEGRLLSGASGRLFDRMLAAIGLDRGAVHLASVACARPVSGRIPRDQVEPLGIIARHYVSLVAPRYLLLLGNCASRTILDGDCTNLRGRLHALNHAGPTDGGTTMALASFHPQLLIERPAQKAEAWKDLQLLLGKLGR